MLFGKAMPDVPRHLAKEPDITVFPEGSINGRDGLEATV
jgi:hypothetical protein